MYTIRRYCNNAIVSITDRIRSMGIEHEDSSAVGSPPEAANNRRLVIRLPPHEELQSYYNSINNTTRMLEGEQQPQAQQELGSTPRENTCMTCVSSLQDGVGATNDVDRVRGDDASSGNATPNSTDVNIPDEASSLDLPQSEQNDDCQSLISQEDCSGYESANEYESTNGYESNSSSSCTESANALDISSEFQDSPSGDVGWEDEDWRAEIDSKQFDPFLELLKKKKPPHPDRPGYLHKMSVATRLEKDLWWRFSDEIYDFKARKLAEKEANEEEEKAHKDEVKEKGRSQSQKGGSRGQGG